jgi:two-component system KDP operon response regulator KdpE
MSHNKILIIEDEQPIGQFLSSSLGAAGFVAHLAGSLFSARQQLALVKPDLIILDLGLPDGEGRDLIPEIREKSDSPILVLSARQEEQEKVRCLDLGADDYLAKPFGIDELLARVRVALRRTQYMHLRDHALRVGDLCIDLQLGQVTLNDQAVHLTPIEFQLLKILARVPGKVITHRSLLTEVWGPDHVDQTHYLRIHMGRLRGKLEVNSAEPRYLLTEPGVGYRLALLPTGQ